MLYEHAPWGPNSQIFAKLLQSSPEPRVSAAIRSEALVTRMSGTPKITAKSFHWSFNPEQTAIASWNLICCIPTDCCFFLTESFHWSFNSETKFLRQISSNHWKLPQMRSRNSTYLQSWKQIQWKKYIVQTLKIATLRFFSHFHSYNANNSNIFFKKKTKDIWSHKINPFVKFSYKSSLK